MRYIKI